MDRDTLEGRSLLYDLESGRVTKEEGSSQDLSRDNRQIQTQNSENGLINNILGPNILAGGELGSNSFVEVIIRDENDGECRDLVEKKYAKNKNKKLNYKKTSKPPRPPRGPELDATDMRLVKEISTHVINKRARIDRLRALRKMREDKSSLSLSKSSVWAMLFTVLFVFVIFFQGFCSQGVDSVKLHGSPEPATQSLITVQFFNNPSANDGRELGSSSSETIAEFMISLVEHVCFNNLLGETLDYLRYAFNPEEQYFGSNFRYHE